MQGVFDLDSSQFINRLVDLSSGMRTTGDPHPRGVCLGAPGAEHRHFLRKAFLRQLMILGLTPRPGWSASFDYLQVRQAPPF